MTTSDHVGINEDERNEVRAAVNGDGQAFARLIDRYQQQVAAQMWKFSRDPATHEELVQETFVEVYRSLGSFRFQSPIIFWIRKIGTRVGYRYWKKKDRLKQQVSLSDITLEQIHDTAENHQSATEAGDTLQLVLSKLPPRDRLVLTLIYWENCSVAEAAQLTGWTQSLVKVQAHRARKKLKKMLEDMES